MQKIEEIVGEVLDAMRRRGLREYTLKHENWSIYRPIINWHHKNGTEYYSEELLEGLCKHQQTRYENGEIQRKYYRSFITAAFRIRSYVDSGTVDFSIVKDVRWFRPNEENQQIADSILENKLSDLSALSHSYLRYFAASLIGDQLSAQALADAVMTIPNLEAAALQLADRSQRRYGGIQKAFAAAGKSALLREGIGALTTWLSL